MSDVRVLLRHARATRRHGSSAMCLAGIRTWCERYGFEYGDLMRDGLPADAVAATGDYFGIKAAALAQLEAEHGR